MIYFVSTTGNDSNPGTEAQPWKKIQKAADTLQAGDTVLVKDGDYPGWVTPARSGTPGDPISYLAYPGDRPVVHDDSGDCVWRINGVAYINVMGFEVWSNHWNACGIKTTNAHHIKIWENILRGCGLGGFGTYTGCDYLDIQCNEIFDCSKTSTYHGSGISLWQLVWYDQAPGFHNIIRGNIVHDNREEIDGGHTDGNGIIIDNSQNPPPTLIENNIVYNNGGKGIQVFSAGNVTIRNNTCYHNSQDPSVTAGGISAYSAKNVKAHSNIVVVNRGPATTVGNSTGIDFHHNLGWGGALLASGIGDVVADPLFVDEGTDDFRLLPDSPARWAGLDGTDMGALPYEEGENGEMATLHDGEEYTFENLEPGIYDVTAAVPADWDLDLERSELPGTPIPNGVGLIVQGGETPGCLFFFKKKLGKVTVRVATDPLGDPQGFEITMTKVG